MRSPLALFVAACATWSPSARATEPAKSISLPDALAYARAHQPAIRAGLARVRARREEAKIPEGQWLPIVGVTGQIFGATANNTTGTYVVPGMMDVPRIGATRATSTGTLSPYPSTFAGAGVTQELFEFGRIAAQRAVADALVEAERAAGDAARLDIELDVEETYFAVFAAKAIVTASEQSYERSRAHRDLAKAGVDAQLRPPMDLTRAEADLARLDIARTKARGGLAVAESALAAAIGAPDAAIDVAGDPPAPADLPALGEAMRLAAARDPRVRQALAQLKADEARTRAIGAELRPDVALTATLSARAGGAPPSSGELPVGNGWVPIVPNWDVGVVFSWPIFDGTVAARQDAARAREEVRREEIAVVELARVAAIRQTYVAVDVARTALPGLVRGVEAARANYEQADARFRAGVATIIELVDAEALRTDAEIQLAIGRFELARARAVFGRAIAEGL
jgi:outer membrane protein TolC